MRLIDADKLLKELDTLFQYHKDHINIHPFVASLATELTLSVIDKVKAAPTIEERKKGKWIIREPWENLYNCSVCGAICDNNKHRYCHCGAEMENAE